jgi:TPR repeat protein
MTGQIARAVAFGLLSVVVKMGVLTAFIWCCITVSARISDTSILQIVMAAAFVAVGSLIVLPLLSLLAIPLTLILSFPLDFLFPLKKRQVAREIDSSRSEDSAGSIESKAQSGIDEVRQRVEELSNPLKDERALRDLEVKARSGDAQAQHELGWRLRLYKPAESWEWTLKAAEQGLVEAQWGMGCYFSIREDKVESALWFRKAADQGHAKAQFQVGENYFAGEGVPQNPVEAAKWYRKAAEQGDPDAQYKMGELCTLGHGVTKDLTEGVQWYRKAGEQGYAAARAALGPCYEKGKGVAKDLAEAVRWYRLSAEQGSDEAIAALKRLGAR